MKPSREFGINTPWEPRKGTLAAQRVKVFDECKSSLTEPFMKCAGGKNRLVRDLFKLLPSKYEGYVDVTLGGGALPYALASCAMLPAPAKVELNDLCSATMLAYAKLAEDSVDFDRQLKALQEEYNNRRGHLVWFDLRKKWETAEGDKALHPAEMVFLRRLAKGPWLYDKDGTLNITYNGWYQVDFDYTNLALCAEAFKGCNLHCLDYSAIEVAVNDLVYVDPPSIDAPPTFFDPREFTTEDQRNILARCAEWSEGGAQVIYSNLCCDTTLAWVRDIWPKAVVFRVKPFVKYASVSHDKRHRGDLIAIGGYDPIAIMSDAL